MHISESLSNEAWTDRDLYKKFYKYSIENKSEFWKSQIDCIYWKKEPDEIYKNGKWLNGGKSNIYYNCVARHAINAPNKIAFTNYFDDPDIRETITYSELDILVKKIVKLLRYKGVKKGDTVAVFMPVRIVSVATMLACAYIGALHVVVFSGFSADVLSYRIKDSNAKLLLTLPEIRRNGKTIDIKKTIDDAKRQLGNIIPETVYMDNIPDIPNVSDNIEWLSNDDEAFILYTSGTSGVFKGVVHASLPYMLYISSTFKTIFDPQPNDTYFCTSDIGWITGHSYMVYAPLFWGLTSVIFDGTPLYPTPDRYWSIIEKEQVSIFYTAPTALRTLKAHGNDFVTKHNLSSLRLLGSVGEPMNDVAWQWFFDIIGQGHCPIIDTWWQTETGGIVLAPLRNLNQQQCVAGNPFFGVDVSIIDGQLVINNDFPGKYKRILNQPLSNDVHNNDIYKTGDCVTVINDEIKITGRVDDLINISGHRLSTIDFERALSCLDEISESATVAIPHEITGQIAIVFVVLAPGRHDSTEYVNNKIKEQIRQSIGAIAKVGRIIYLDRLPKTSTGKIERQKLREIAISKQSV